jgi:WD40 repeat protein
MVTLTCSGCGRALEVKAGRAGQKVRCPACRQVTVIPFSAHDAPETLQPAANFSDSGATLAPPAPDGEPAGREGVRVPGYEILAEVGRGGMGVVYQARQVKLNRVVALKMILAGGHASATDLARFRSEAEAIARLSHPNIVQVYEVGEHDGLAFFSLEFCAGGSLEKKLDGTPLPPMDAAVLVEKLARAMQEAHQAGVVHRDLKPANVLLSFSRDAERSALSSALRSASRLNEDEPKITDFGLAKRLDQQGQTQTGAIMGTPSYMAPEQAEGKKDVGPPADVYALGAILYECLTGRPPFKAATPFDTIMQVLSDEPVPPTRLQPRTPIDLETICLKCLQKRPGDRYSSAGDLADDLGRFLRGEPIAARPVGALERGWKWVCRHPSGTGLGVASIVAALALVAFFVSQSYQGRLAEANTRLAAALDEAERARHNEEEQKKQTEAALERVERFRYFNLIALAGREVAANDLGRADELLDQCPEGLRGWEWNYLRGRAHLPRTISRKHKDQVLCVAYSSDGDRLASGGRDGSVRIRDENLWREKVVLIPAHKGAVRAVALSPDGLHLASAGDDHVVRVFELTNKKDVFRPDKGGKLFVERFVLRQHERPVLAIAYSPDGRRLASADEGGTVLLWEPGAGQPRRLDGHKGAVRGLAFSRGGKELASAGADRLVKVWEAASGKFLFQLPPLPGPGGSLVWILDDRQLAVAVDDPDRTSQVMVWNVALEGRARRPQVLAVGVFGLAWDASSGYLVLAGRDGTVHLCYMTGRGGWIILRGHSGSVTSVAFRPDGKVLASGGGQPGQPGEVITWKLPPPPAVRVLRGHTAATTSVAFNPDGSRLVSAGKDGLIKVWDLLTSRTILTLKGHAGGVTGVAFSPDLHLLASSGEDSTVRLWSAASGQLLHTLKGHTGTVTGISFSADGKRLASGGGESGKPGDVKVWQVVTRRVLLTLSGHASPVTAIAFSPDGRRVASGSRDQMVRIHDLTDGKEVLVLAGQTGGVTSVAFSPDGRRLAAAGLDRTVWLWDAVSGKRLHVLTGHSAEVLGVAFSATGKRIGTASADMMVKLWDPQTGLEACTLSAMSHGATAVAFSIDRRIASTNADGPVNVWEVVPTKTGPEEIDQDG